MKITIYLLPLFILLPVLIYAQNITTDTSATCVTYWKNKETKVYAIKHSKEKFSDTKGSSASEATYEAHIKVTDSVASGFTIQWVYKNFKAGGITDNTINSLNAIMEGLTVVYKTDDLGMFSELINWKEVSNFALSNYEKAIAANKNSEFTAALNQIRAIFQSKENIEALLIREVQLFHAPYGVEYGKKGTIAETELPNVTGGAPFPATIILKADEINTKKDYCTISLNQSINKGKAGPIMAAMLKKLAGAKQVNEEEIKQQIKGLEISDYNSFNYTLSSGWMNKVVYKRIANIGAAKQIETYEITVVK